MLGRHKQNLVVTRTQWKVQWPALGTEALAAAVLRGAAGEAIVLLEEVATTSTIDPPGGLSKTGEQSYQRSSRTLAKVLGPTTDFPIWGSGKTTESPEKLTLKVSGISIQSFHRTEGNRDFWRTQTKSIPRRKEQGPFYEPNPCIFS